MPFPRIPGATRPAGTRFPLPILVILLAVLVPGVSRAQAAARAQGDTPSRSAETRRVADSLTVQRLRHPKAKPAGYSATAGARSAVPGKHLGAVDTTTYPAMVTTPLPRKNRRSATTP
ncbi:MAG: hypothetical protein IT355_01365 [Gemmatimonadaceae bacterium]|nr:hypothetical protein [Gemmatimonadaceae bacterium]